MVTAVTPVAILEATPAAAPRAPAPPPAPTQPPPIPASEPSHRLVIEDVGSGQFVYKTLDRATGEVLRQLPREEVVKMREEATYQAGDLIETEA